MLGNHADVFMFDDVVVDKGRKNGVLRVDCFEEI